MATQLAENFFAIAVRHWLWIENAYSITVGYVAPKHSDIFGLANVVELMCQFDRQVPTRVFKGDEAADMIILIR